VKQGEQRGCRGRRRGTEKPGTDLEILGSSRVFQKTKISH
jgi:hypothetical protein